MPPISEALRALSGSRVQDLGLERTFSESRLNVNCDSSLLHFFRDFFCNGYCSGKYSVVLDKLCLLFETW